MLNKLFKKIKFENFPERREEPFRITICARPFMNFSVVGLVISQISKIPNTAIKKVQYYLVYCRGWAMMTYRFMVINETVKSETASRP